MVNVLRIYGLMIVATILAAMPSGCGPRDYCDIPAYSDGNYLQAVIEIPAGTSTQIAYCKLTHRFRVRADEQGPQRVAYLPYPFNYGFIPSTSASLDPEDRDMLEVMVISESLATGTVLEVIPLALLVLKDDFTTQYKVLAIPSAPEKQIINAGLFEEFKTKYPSVTDIIEDWFIGSGLYRNPEIVGWQDEHVTRNFIQKRTAK